MPFSKVAGDQTGTLLWKGGAEGVVQWSGAHRGPSSLGVYNSQMTDNCLQLQSPGTSHPLLASGGTKLYLHIIKKIKTFKKIFIWDD